MRVEDLLVYGKKYCHSDISKILLGDLLNLNPLELLIHLDEEVSEEKALIYKEEVKAIKENKPLQYVLGYTNFYGNKFIVNEKVLIPRFETEELVENTINYIKEYFNIPVNIIDLGCGSGVIGLTLKQKIKDSDVTLLDISEDALKVAQENSKQLNLPVKFIKNNMLENLNEKYDVIISNPPYIKTNEEIEEIVKNNEPHLALYAGEDGLDYYRSIINNIQKNLKEKYLIAFEIGYEQKDPIVKLLNEKLNDITIITKKDMQDRNRMIFVLSNSLIKSKKDS